ncbi:Pentatricopeptide repeat-containing protein [Acorus gramineus]|uniref:Pentatricopeptide repeat-containing protein n=1 Tax=Acorus gramineus TaxID=55184 RepID=A0AAV9BKZ9_ACOGR|nr:Pentatricopeptide repeat-containing protein [Acorus gramineus]
MQRLKKIQAQVHINGHQHDPLISNKLLSFCAISRSGDTTHAQTLFTQIENPQTEAFNSMIRSFSQTPSPQKSFFYYNLMITGGVPSPDAFTFAFLFKACERSRAETKSREAHASAIRYGFVSDVLVATNLLSSYSENGSIDSAKRVFDEMREKDLVAWNSMISCYVRAGLHDEARKVYDFMRYSEVGPDGFTLVALLSSCAEAGALNFGVRLHRLANESGLCDRNVIVCNALVDMYAKCGRLDLAWGVFDSMSSHCEVSTWNSMIVGLGVHGRGDEAVSIFDRMVVTGIRPNAVTFLGLLSGCSHQGLVREGLHYFGLMSSKFNVKPGIKHYGCLVDLLGRAGMLEEALAMIRSSHCSKDPVLWRTLLSASKVHRNVEMGGVANENLVRLGARNAGECVLLAGLYAETGDKRAFAEMRKTIKRKGIKTAPGWSWIEVEGDVRRFGVGDKSHCDSDAIHEKVKEMVHRAMSIGYVEEKSKLFVAEESRGCHSEKLAIAFGLLRTTEQTGLRVVKNLRVCRDCHALTKFVSKAFGREIIVRDRVRFHHFKDGSCSCNDFW